MVKIFRTEKEKFNAIIKQILDANEKKQPVLIGTTSIEKSERISKILKYFVFDHLSDRVASVLTSLTTSPGFRVFVPPVFCLFDTKISSLPL
jgi:hypothetical protein